MGYIQRMQKMALQGMDRDAIADEMMVSRKWVDMVMDTDAFQVEQKGGDHGTGNEDAANTQGA